MAVFHALEPEVEQGIIHDATTVVVTIAELLSPPKLFEMKTWNIYYC